jgi:hypothetical protein
MPQTTSKIIDVKPSKQKPQLMINNSEFIQEFTIK